MKKIFICIVIGIILIGGNSLLARHMAKPILAKYDKLIENAELDLKQTPDALYLKDVEFSNKDGIVTHWYTFEPQEDITTYELALILKDVFRVHAIYMEHWPENIRRHFEEHGAKQPK